MPLRMFGEELKWCWSKDGGNGGFSDLGGRLGRRKWERELVRASDKVGVHRGLKARRVLIRRNLKRREEGGGAASVAVIERVEGTDSLQ